VSGADRNKCTGVDDEPVDRAENLKTQESQHAGRQNCNGNDRSEGFGRGPEILRGTLHLKKSGPEIREAANYKSGNSTIVIYQSQYAGTNKATAATWNVGDELEAVVRTLKNAGVAFEHYDMPGIRREGDIHIVGDFKTAWFKDPDGNILNINNG
jgi:hypothetical protein